ncbi:putative quinol monooxygenase [Microlunatus parietis]|uniref:Quinol monooxygenase YgiN n=1 Tax=Microlunatus parietis TaxID=682979 RepID=A0A7Y9LE23_9ACTN|nr:antibiotic biosynthesis monooxygenase family protein [Microlunatus parietis]NYE73378.1 quinol monooxygenase YgiN [Microlunatus parietis]
MIIIAGHLRLDPTARDAFVAAHRDLVARARAFPGCLDLAITADSVDPSRVNNLEVWQDAEALTAWRAVAAAPDLGTAIRAAEVKRYDAVDGGPLF